MSICKFEIFSGGYTTGSPLTGEGKREGRKKGRGEGMGKRREGDKGYRTGRRGGDGIRKKGKGKGREAHPLFSPTSPQFELSRNKPVSNGRQHNV
jgi:hypothetical protein